MAEDQEIMRHEAWMPAPADSGEVSNASFLTLAEMLFRFKGEHARRELESFRIEYEAEFGETDLTRRYTSTWSADEQDWLLKHHPERYWAGLPPFVQAFLKNKMMVAHKQGILDDMPASYLRLYLTDKMNLGGRDRDR
jgi:hypothetical protein